MNLFSGTFENFNFYFNDFVKNKVPYLTRKHKNCLCELCQQEKATDAAHIRGHERMVLIRQAFESSVVKQEGQVYSIDLKKFSDLINEMHSNPRNFHFLCKKCHRAYDAENSTVQEEDFHKKF